MVLAQHFCIVFAIAAEAGERKAHQASPNTSCEREECNKYDLTDCCWLAGKKAQQILTPPARETEKSVINTN
jgi:hypothetical protein